MVVYTDQKHILQTGFSSSFVTVEISKLQLEWLVDSSPLVFIEWKDVQAKMSGMGNWHNTNKI